MKEAGVFLRGYVVKIGKVIASERSSNDGKMLLLKVLRKWMQ